MRLAVVTMDDGAAKSRTNNTVARDYDLQGQSFKIVDYIGYPVGQLHLNWIFGDLVNFDLPS